MPPPQPPRPLMPPPQPPPDLLNQPPLPSQTPSSDLPSENLIGSTIDKVFSGVSLILQTCWFILAALIPYCITFFLAFSVPAFFGVVAVQQFGRLIKEDYDVGSVFAGLALFFIHVMLVMYESREESVFASWSAWFQPLFVSALTLSILIGLVSGVFFGSYLALQVYRRVARGRASHASGGTPWPDAEKDGGTPWPSNKKDDRV